jgi:hypothetical protein
VEDTIECVVCYNEVVHKKAFKTVCGHIFCKTCLKKWLLRNHTCPLCRTQLRDPEPESPTEEDIEAMANHFIAELVRYNQIAVSENNNLYITVELDGHSIPLLEQWNNHVENIDQLIHLI